MLVHRKSAWGCVPRAGPTVPGPVIGQDAVPVTTRTPSGLFELVLVAPVLAKNSLRPDYARSESQSSGHELMNDDEESRCWPEGPRQRSIGTSCAQESESVPEYTRAGSNVRI